MCLILIIVILLGLGTLKANVAYKSADFWQDGYCVQSTAKTPPAGSKIIEARLEDKWESLPLVDFPDTFWTWNKARRTEYLETFRQMLSGKEHGGPKLSGPHNGMVATWGIARGDSQFKLNNAVKGCGFLPKAEKLAEITELLQSNIDSDMSTKLNILDSLYQSAEEVFEADRLVSLELYSEPGYNTQTFINQMLAPACVTVFLDIPTFKIKQIARLLDPLDPKLSSYEKAAVRYVNLVHSFFHGDFPRDYITVIYYNIEIYDSSPGRSEGRGTKISP